jgi:hypothetical protein
MECVRERGVGPRYDIDITGKTFQEEVFLVPKSFIYLA